MRPDAARPPEVSRDGEALRLDPVVLEPLTAEGPKRARPNGERDSSDPKPLRELGREVERRSGGSHRARDLGEDTLVVIQVAGQRLVAANVWWQRHLSELLEQLLLLEAQAAASVWQDGLDPCLECSEKEQ